MSPILPGIRRTPLLAFLLASSALLAGCTGACSPVEVPTQVSLALADEEVRMLPVLTSGATVVAGQALPDAHGRLDFVVDVAHEGLDNQSLAFQDIDIMGLRVSVTVAGEQVPVEVLRVQGGSGWHQRADNLWDGGAVNGSRVTLWWTIDRDQERNPANLVLPEGATYTATVDFDWRHESCVARAAGHVTTPFNDFVQAVVNARTFAPVTAPSIELKDGGVGLRADYRVTSGLDATITGVSARAVLLATGTELEANASAGSNATAQGGALDATTGLAAEVDVAAPLPMAGLVLFPSVGFQVGNTTSDLVTPADTLRVRSVGADASAYAASGTLLPPVLTSAEGLWIVYVDITYEPEDPTLGVTTDSFVYAVVKE